VNNKTASVAIGIVLKNSAARQQEDPHLLWQEDRRIQSSLRGSFSTIEVGTGLVDDRNDLIIHLEFTAETLQEERKHLNKASKTGNDTPHFTPLSRVFTHLNENSKTKLNFDLTTISITASSKKAGDDLSCVIAALTNEHWSITPRLIVIGSEESQESDFPY
jgi:hypothetical protein